MNWLKNTFLIINKKYLFINRLFVHDFIKKCFSFSYDTVYKLFDKGLIEFIGPFGMVSTIKQLLYSQYKLQSGLIYHYSGFLFIMLIFMLHFLFDSLYFDI